MEDRIYSGIPIQWGEIGVYLWRNFFQNKIELNEYILEPNVFCPINYFELSKLICRTKNSSMKNAAAIHLWNDIWRRGNLDKNAEYHPLSIYESLKRKYF